MSTINRTLILMFGIMLIFQCCGKVAIDQIDELTESGKYFLDFDIIKLDYNEPDQESKFVKSDQTVDFVTFHDVNESNRHFYFNVAPTSSADSITLIGAVIFQNSEISTFDEDQSKIELFLTEHKANLEDLGNGNYRYKTNETLYHKLQDENWGNQGLFSNKYINQLLLTLPSVTDTIHTWGLEMVSSNGFYFDHEMLELTHVQYDGEANVIELGGNFDVNIKELSCGFYDFYHVTNAEFLIEIR